MPDVGSGAAGVVDHEKRLIAVPDAAAQDHILRRRGDLIAEPLRKQQFLQFPAGGDPAFLLLRRAQLFGDGEHHLDRARHVQPEGLVDDHKLSLACREFHHRVPDAPGQEAGVRHDQHVVTFQLPGGFVKQDIRLELRE